MSHDEALIVGGRETLRALHVLGGEDLVEEARREGSVSLIRQGLPAGSVGRLAQFLTGVNAAQLADMVGMSRATLQRLKGTERRLTPVQSDRAFRLASVISLAMETFEDEGAARRWLDKPNRALGGHSPKDLLDTEVGCRQVEDLLGRIEYGVFS